MPTRHQIRWAAVAALVASIPLAARPAGGQDGKDKNAEKHPPEAAGDAAPSAVRRVAVTPLKEQSPAGGPVMEVRVPDPGEKRLVRGSATQNLKLGPAEAVATATVRVAIDPAELLADQKRYEEDLGAALGLVDFRDRRRSTPDPKTIKQWRAVPTPVGQETVLPPYLGSPVLAANDLDKVIDRCLMIRDTGVVDNNRAKGMGVWSFGHLVTEMANEKATGITPAEFARRWLEHWETDQTVNGVRVENRREGVRALVIDPWQAASGGPGRPLDLAKAPFRLMAIINRLDLSSNAVLGADRIGDGGAGEARLVYCLLDTRKEKNLDKAPPTRFTVIFEYGIKRRGIQAVRDWAADWYELRRYNPKTEDYRNRLARLTQEFVQAGADPESPPNRSALAQIRTNEIELDLVAGELGIELDRVDGVPRPLWELREFVVNTHDDGFLYQVTVKQTPRFTLRGGATNPRGGGRLAAYVNTPENEQAILSERHRLAVRFPAGRSFVDGAAITPLNFFWAAPGAEATRTDLAVPKINNPDARHLLSLATCSGCHSREAFPEGPPEEQFTHLFPLTRVVGTPAKLSPFLTGKDKAGNQYKLADPAGQTHNGQVVRREFADLERRAYFLRNFVRYFIYFQLNRVPIQNVH